MPNSPAPAPDAKDALRELVRLCDLRDALEDEYPAGRSDNWPIDHDECLRELEVALDAARAALSATEQDWVRVPRVPTEDMLVFGQEAWWAMRKERRAAEDCHEAAAVYAAMLASAPVSSGQKRLPPPIGHCSVCQQRQQACDYGCVSI